VAAGVAREESDVVAGGFAGDESIGGRAEGRFEPNFRFFREGGELVKAAAADDTDGRRHRQAMLMKSTVHATPFSAWLGKNDPAS
jgi:hypothetical protein